MTSKQAPPDRVVCCVTGAAGFLGGWIVRRLLEEGCVVHACLRDKDDAPKAAFLRDMGAQFAEGQLMLHSVELKAAADALDAVLRTHRRTAVVHTAELYMSAPREIKAAKAAGDTRHPLEIIHAASMAAHTAVAQRASRSGTVKRVVFVSSDAAMMEENNAGGFFASNAVVDESRYPREESVGRFSYNWTKVQAERMFAQQAVGTSWDTLIVNPCDMIGPILSPHQAADNWQGQVSSIMRGEAPDQTDGGRPWITADVRDCAEAMVRMVCATDVPAISGTRHLLSACDKIYSEDVGKRVMELYPHILAATSLKPDSNDQAPRNPPIWMRVNHRNDRVRGALPGFTFRPWDESVSAMVDSLIAIGGVVPNLAA